MKNILLALSLLFLIAPPAYADVVVPVSSIPLSGSIATTNTFQSIQIVTNNRLGCTIQNNGTHTMYVYFGAIANATTSASSSLTPGSSLNCWITPGYVLKDQVSITGTSTDSYYANFQ